MTTFAQRERAALCDTLRAVGPDAPTLCQGWAAKDLAAHLVLREHRPLASIGIWLPPLSGRTAQVQAQLAAQPWDTLVAQVAQRPARWHPAGLSHTLESLFDDGELFVHHEDLRRGDGTPQPRELTLADEQSLWRSLKGAARLALRKSPVTVVAEAPGRPRTVLKSAKDREVVVRGSVGEILLTVFGRRRAAAVDLLGSVGDVQAFEANLRGL